MADPSGISVVSCGELASLARFRLLLSAFTCLAKILDGDLAMHFGQISVRDVAGQIGHSRVESHGESKQCVEACICLTPLVLTDVFQINLRQLRQIILADCQFVSELFDSPPDRQGCGMYLWRSGHASMFLNPGCNHQRRFNRGYLRPISRKSAVEASRSVYSVRFERISQDVVVVATRRGDMWGQKSFLLGDMWITSRHARNCAKSCPQRAPPDGGNRCINDIGVTTSSCG